MYAEFYGLTSLPFQLTPDSHFFFSSAGHGRAISHLVYGLQQQEGFIVITGEVGAGKTILVDVLAAQLDPATYLIVRIATTLVSGDDLLRLVADGFGLAVAPDKAALLRQVETRLRALSAEGRRALLVVDEVQGLSVAALEELRMVSNLAEAGRSLLQIVLLGQPEFRQTLARPELNQLRQRVLASYHLGPLSPAETRAYVLHRLAAAGWIGYPGWDDAAFPLVHQYSAGIPRRINRLCSRVLLHSGLDEIALITADAVESIAAELAADIGGDQAPAMPVSAAGADQRLNTLEGKFERLLDLLENQGRGAA